MPEKTKTKGKTGNVKKASRRAEEDSQVIRLLTICFTLLSVAFTAMAFWKYPLN